MVRKRKIACAAIAAAGSALALLASGGAWATSTSIVFNFTGGTQAASPFAGVIRTAAGVIYGTTSKGGGANAGVIYSVTPAGVESVVHSFKISDGGDPSGELIMDAGGSIYGTTRLGGKAGVGTVFKVAPNGSFTSVYSLPGGLGGAAPQGRLALDQAGNIYGTTSDGGWNHCGVVFKVAPNGTGSVVHTFSGGTDSTHPMRSSLVIDGQGNLYGTTLEGGATYSGTVFRITPDGTETVLHSFGSFAGDGLGPRAGVIMDSQGNLYGTTESGGAYNRGTVFKLSPGGTETVVYSFPGGAGGAFPYYGLVMSPAGTLFGATLAGGVASCNCGTVFSVTSAGHGLVLHAFTGSPDGKGPVGNVALDSAGNLYGATYSGGSGSAGTVFEVAH